MHRRTLLTGLAATAAAVALESCRPGQTPVDEAGRIRIRFAADGPAQAGHGGFYQALATGLYAGRGLNVEILQGGPDVNVPRLLASGAVELGLGSNSFVPMTLTAESAPVSVVAAFFQKDPQILIAHPEEGLTSIAGLADRPFMLRESAVTGFWAWLKSQYGFTDEQLRPYDTDPATFLADPLAVRQGSLTRDPFTLRQDQGFEPQVFLLADEGYPSYAAMLLAPDGLIRDNRAAVAAFIDASAEGWRSYLTEDSRPADGLIRDANPEMSPDLLAYARQTLIDNDIVMSEGGRIGDMTAARWEAFFDVTSQAGVYAPNVDWRSAFTLDFLRS